MEALKWFKRNKNKSAFASNHFGETKNALKFVKALYKAGAPNIEVDDSQMYDEPYRIQEEGGPYCATLLVELPNDNIKRIEIMAKIFNHHPDEIYQKIEYRFERKINWQTAKQVRLWWD